MWFEQKVGNVYIGGTKIQFADIIPYLNKALEFLEEREKTEAALLRLHMDLYENWQVDVIKMEIRTSLSWVDWNKSEENLPKNLQDKLIRISLINVNVYDKKCIKILQ